MAGCQRKVIQKAKYSGKRAVLPRKHSCKHQLYKHLCELCICLEKLKIYFFQIPGLRNQLTSRSNKHDPDNSRVPGRELAARILWSRIRYSCCIILQNAQYFLLPCLISGRLGFIQLHNLAYIYITHSRIKQR